MIKQCFFILVALLSLASQASAAIVYRLSFDSTGSSLITNANMNLGDSATFNVYLHELFIDGTDTPRIGTVAGEDGLVTANFAVNRSVGTSANIVGAAGNALFDLDGAPLVGVTADSATIKQEIGIFSDPVVATTFAPGRRTVQIGSVTLSALSPGLTTFNLADFSIADDLVIGDGISPPFIADGAEFGQLNITAVPEPSSCVLLGLSTLGAAVWQRRKLRKQAV